MIKFFRHIRKSLLERNKMGKYFKYAIGEIVLVVVGILIALQINNWNEQRKNQAFEKELLEQIRANLIKDKLTLTDIKSNFESALSSTDKILNASWNQNERDSVKYWLGDIIQFDRFQPLTNAYEVAKSKGLDLISNKQLRFIIGTYYDDDSKNVTKSIEDIENAFGRDWVDFMKNEVQEMKFKEYVILKDIEVLKDHPVAINNLRFNIDNYNGGYQRIKKVIKLLERIIESINQELN